MNVEAQMNNGINMRTNRELTSHMIADLVFVITNCTAGIRAASMSLDPDEPPKASATDGGPAMALESVLNRACDRLETILNDGDRWQLPQTDMRAVAISQLSQQLRQGEIILRAQAAQAALNAAAEFMRPPENQNQPPTKGTEEAHGE